MKPTREQVIAWAREATREPCPYDYPNFGAAWSLTLMELVRSHTLAYEAGRKDENEACAKVCLEEAPSLDGGLCADAIRARGEK